MPGLGGELGGRGGSPGLLYLPLMWLWGFEEAGPGWECPWNSPGAPGGCVL